MGYPDAAGLSLALGAFLAGMMLAETEFRHQIEATIRSYREMLHRPVLHHHRHAARCARCCSRNLLLVSTLVVGMLVVKATVVVAVVAKPATNSWFKSVRTGVVV